MSTISTLPTSVAAPATSASPRPPDDPAEAARQFESVLVRQFVEVMTKDLFQSDDEGMMTGQADLQRDTLTDTLTEHLVESDTFGVADLLMKQWERSGRVPTEAGTAGPTAPEAAAPATRRPMTMEQALRLYPAAQEPARSIDHPEDTP